MRMWPIRFPTTSPTTLGRVGSMATVRIAEYPSLAISLRDSSATSRSSPGGFGLGVATRFRANSTRSRSRAARARSTSRSPAVSARLDGGVRLLVAGSAGSFDPISAGPADALPGLELVRLDLEEPSWLLHRGFEICRAVLAEISIAHASCNRHPFPADVGPLDQLGVAAAENLTEVLGLLDHKRRTRIVLEVSGPARVLAWNDPEVAILPLMPADSDVWTSFRRETCEVHVDPEAEELVDLFRRHAPDLAPPGLIAFRHVYLPQNKGDRPIPS